MSVPAFRKPTLSGRLVAALLAFALVVTGFVLLGGGPSVAAEAASGPAVTSDQADYPPGALVTLTGSGWQAGEPVHVTVNDDQGRTWQRDVDLTADDAGAFTDSFNLPSWFVATYAVVATGASSGEVRSSFTDGNVKVSSVVDGSTGQTVSVPVKYSVTTSTSTCPSTDPSTPFTITATDQTLTGGAGDNDRVKIVAPATVTDGNGVHTFVGWVVGTTTSTDTTLCTSGNSTGSKSVAVKYSTGVPTDVGTTTTVASSTPTSTYADSVKFTATVSGSPSAGTVTFADGANTLCSAVSLSSGTAACSTSSLAAGSHTVTASYSGAAGFKPSSGNATQSVAQKQVTGAFKAADKIYDGSRTATITDWSLPSGVLASDAGSVTLKNGTATFDSAAAGPGKTVTGTGFSLGGPAAGNYVLASTTLTTTAKIGQQGVTVGFAAGNKEYDGTTAATITSSSITSGQVAGDDLTVSGGTAAFGSRDAGTGKTVTASGFTLGGAAKDNYVVTSVTSTTASVTAKPVTGSFTASNKTYDRSADATVTGRSLAGVLGSDDVSLAGGTAAFADRNVGTGKPVTLSGASLTGTGAKNYDLTSVADAKADITPKSVDGSFTAEGKTYDGNASASIDARSLTGVIDGDAVLLTGGTATFADRNADTGKTVTASGFALGGADAGNYVLSSTSLTTKADITPRTVTGSFSAADKGYDGTATASVLTPKLSDAISGDDVHLVVNDAAFGSKNVGTGKTVTGTLSLSGADAGNYALSSTTGTTTADVLARHITGGFTAADKVYDADTDATVVTRTLSHTVQGDDVILDAGTASFADAFVGSGKVVTLEGAQLTGKDAGNYVLDSVGTATATIGKRDLQVTADPQTKVYGQDDPALTYTIDGSLQGGDKLTGALTRASGQDVGQYAIQQGSLSAGDNYALTFVPGTLSVTKKKLTVTADDTHRTYGDTNPDFAASYDGFVQGDDASDLGGPLSFATQADKGSPVGDYLVTPSGLTSRNYDITFKPGTLTVDKRDLTITADGATKTYGDELALGTTGFTTKGLTNSDTVTGVALSSDGAAASAPVNGYAIHASAATGQGLGNYAISYVDGTLRVDKAPLSIVAADKTKVYGDANPALTGDVTGVRNNDDVTASYSTAADGTSGVNTYLIVPVAVGDGAVLANYDVTLTNGTLTVTPRELVIKADDTSKIYGDTNPDLTGSIDGVQNSDPIMLAVTTAATEKSGVGGYDTVPHAVAASLAVLRNYTVKPTSGTLTVTARDLFIKADDASKVYGDANPALTGSMTGLQNADPITLGLTTAATEKSGVGSYDVVPHANGADAVLANYTVKPTNGTLTVGKAPLSVAADDSSKVYGSDNPPFTVRYAGFVNGEDASALTGTLGFDTGATAGSGVGSYPVTPKGLTSDNYAISFAPGSLTVTRKALSVTADADPSTAGVDHFTKVYGSANPAFAVRYAGWVNGDGPSSLDGTPAFDTSATSSSNVGAYSVTPKGLTSGNYDITFNAGTLDVTRKALSVTADADTSTADAEHFTKVLGSANPTFTARFDGFVNGEGPSVLGGTLGFDTPATTGSPVGAYSVTPKGLTSGNYDITFKAGTLDVLYRWDGYLQPINDTAHQIGTSESKFKAGQTIPAKFVLKDVSGNVVQQSGNPVFSQKMVSTSCDSTTSSDTGTTDSQTAGGSYVWNGSQYQYNWSTKGLGAGEYLVKAGLADGTQQSVYVCLTK